MLLVLSALATSLAFILLALPFLPILGAVVIVSRLRGEERSFLAI